MAMKNKMTKIKCKYCNYIIQTKSTLQNITCSNCQKKTPNRETREKE